MSLSGITPGPWVVREVKGLGLPGQVGYAIDFNADQEQVVDYVYEKADAYLIAAAPDLLAALQAARAMWGDYLPPGNSNAMKAMKLVDSAIDKALGQ